MKLLACVALLFALLSSCSKPTCQNPGVQVSFSGFDTIKLSLIRIQQYYNIKDTAPMQVSIQDTADTLTQIYQVHDTLFYPANTLSKHIDLVPGFDYKIVLPLAKRTFIISSISFHPVSKHYSNSGSGGCTNDASYYVDSIPVLSGGSVYNSLYPPPVNIVLKK